jgi:hypothetical protein
MKKLILFFFVLTFQIFAQGIYFSVPTSSSVFQSSGGQAAIPYNFYHSNGIVVYTYYARLTYPDGTQSDWMIGETGGWWVTKAGIYQIEGKPGFRVFLAEVLIGHIVIHFPLVS